MAKAKAKKSVRPAVRKPAATKGALPKIGAKFEGGKFAGNSLHEGKACALVLLPGTFTGKWADAIAWAKKLGGELPNRHDGIVLFDNLKKEFEASWYWTAVVHPSDADCAFIQGFAYGTQGNAHKDGGYRARAVRRVAI